MDAGLPVVDLSHSSSVLQVRIVSSEVPVLLVNNKLLHRTFAAGGTASGKTTVCDQIMQRLHDQCVVMLSQDSFYRGLTPEECKNIKGKPAFHILRCVQKQHNEARSVLCCSL